MLSQDYKPFFDKLYELAELANEAKMAIDLAKDCNPKLSFCDIHNEMKEALFPIIEIIYKANKGDIKCDSEFRTASFHFRSAGHKSYKLICTKRIKEIKTFRSKYDDESIKTVIQGDFVGMIEIIQIDAQIKQTEEDLFKYFSKQATILTKYVELLKMKEPIIIEIQKKKTKKETKKILISIIIGIILALLSFILGAYQKELMELFF